MKLASVMEQIRGGGSGVPKDINLPALKYPQHNNSSPAYPPKLGNIGGPPDQLRVLGLQQQTLMKQLGLDKTQQGSIHYQQVQQIEKGHDETSNPFKLQKNLEGMVVNREKERFLQKLQRDSSLRE